MKNKILGYLLGIAGLAICHLLGVLQFMVVAKMSLPQAFLLSSAPYIIKDIISIILAYLLGKVIKKALSKAGYNNE